MYDMKRLGLIAVILAGVVSITSCSSTRSVVHSEADEVRQQFIGQMLQKKMYKVDFTRAYPQGGPSFTMNYPYFVSVIGDRVESFLPYFGRAYSIPYGGGEGLHFEAPVRDYSMKEGKKGQQVITFNARTDEDDYNFNLEVYPSGEAYLSINAVHKQGMSFSGNIDEDPEFEVLRLAD